jgi:hypothetical protein
VLGHNAGFRNRDEIMFTDLLDAIHSRQGKDDAAANRNASSHVPLAGAACGHRNLVFVRKTQDRCHRSGASRQRNRIRWMAGKPFISRMLLTKLWIECELARRQLPLESLQ